MHLTTLELDEFRAYQRLSLEFDPGGLRLFGANASGKTTLLEAIAMLATTRSPRTSSERETIAWASGEMYGVPPYARARANVERRGGPFVVEMAIESDPARGNTARKEIRIDGRLVRAADAVGWLKAVLFSVEDVTLVSGPPVGRRRYLDITISQLSGRYLKSVSRFNRVLLQRNSLLKSFQRDRVSWRDPSVSAQLAFWNEELIGYGSLVVAFRYLVTSRLADLLDSRFRSLAGDRSLRLGYRPSLDLASLEPVVQSDESDRTDEIQAVVARDYVNQLADALPDEVRRGVTLVGPHRDDLSFTADGIDLAAFGSRGEQRLAVVGLKLAEADLLTHDAGEPPVLLLDDVLSELDPSHREHLVADVSAIHGQVLITSTDRHLLDTAQLADLPEARVSRGAVSLV